MSLVSFELLIAAGVFNPLWLTRNRWDTESRFIYDIEPQELHVNEQQGPVNRMHAEWSSHKERERQRRSDDESIPGE